jgi:hypothetical protein
MRFLIIFWIATVSALAGHPRLFFSVGEVPVLREKVRHEPFASMLEEIRRMAEEKHSHDSMYAFEVRNWAYIYLFTGDKDSAKKAEAAALRLIEDGAFWNNPQSKGLSRAMGALNVAVAYDLCHEAWSPETRDRVSAQLGAAARNLMASMGAGANTRTGNNWQAVRYAAAGLAALASDDLSAKDIPPLAYRELLKHFRANLAGGIWNPEGIGYTIYPWGFSGPFGIAAARAGLGDLRKDLPNLREAILPPLLTTVPIPQGRLYGLHPDLSDDNPIYVGEGTAGLAFYYASPDRIAGLKWIYDRLLGASGDRSWDSNRAGTLYSILYYPSSTEAVQPRGTGWTFFYDPKVGVVMDRNRFLDGDDIVFATNATSRRADGGHSGPDVNTIRLIGLGAPFLVGGGRTGHTAGQTNLFPGPPADKGDDTLGKILQAEEGRLLVEGSCMGVDSHRRAVAIDYSGMSGAPGFFVNGETSRNGRIWRLNTPEFNTVKTDGNHITITSPAGSSLVVTLLEPAAPVFRTGIMERSTGDTNLGIPYHGVTYRSNKWIETDVQGRVFAVMTLQKGNAPAVKSTRHLHGIEALIGRQPASMDFDSGQVFIGEKAATLNLANRRNPLRVVELSTSPIEGGGIRLTWPVEQLGAELVEIRRRPKEESVSVTLDTVALSGGAYTDHPTEGVDWIYEIAAVNEHGPSATTASNPVRAWPPDLKHFVEDFAAAGESPNQLGEWTLKSSGQRVPGRTSEPGSPTRAAIANGTLSTGVQPIQTRHDWTCEWKGDLSSPAACFEIDILSNAAIGISPLLKLADGQWLLGSNAWFQSKNSWRTFSVSFEGMKWTDMDIETGASMGTARPIEPQRLRTVTGVGFRVVHPINNRSAKIDQFTVRAQPAAPSSK